MASICDLIHSYLRTLTFCARGSYILSSQKELDKKKKNQGHDFLVSHLNVLVSAARKRRRCLKDTLVASCLIYLFIPRLPFFTCSHDFENSGSLSVLNDNHDSSMHACAANAQVQRPARERWHRPSERTKEKKKQPSPCMLIQVNLEN